MHPNDAPGEVNADVGREWLQDDGVALEGFFSSRDVHNGSVVEDDEAVPVTGSTD